MIEWDKLVKWQDDWLKIHPEAIAKRKEFLREVVLYEDYDAFKNAFTHVLNSRTMLIRSMVDVYADQLELDSSVNITSTLERLLEIAADLDENQEPEPQRWFEALARFDQVVAVAKIERAHSRGSLSRDMQKLLVFLRHNWFQKGRERVEVNCYHDPANDFRVLPENVGVNEMLDRPHLEHRRAILPCRRVEGIGYVYLRDRIKDSFNTWLKIQRQLKDPKCKNPFEVQDLCGITLLFPTEADLHNGVKSLTSLLESHGGKILETTQLNQRGDRRMDGGNKYSSPDYRAAKLLVSFLGGIFEIQFQTFYDYYTSKRSPTKANHDLYRLIQTLDESLPLLWPHVIYDVDWSNPVIRAAALQAKVDQLGWRVKGNLQ